MSNLETGIVIHPVGRDWDRYYERDLDRGNRHQPDVDLLREMISLVKTADHFGYDFVFAPEHHVSPYGLSTSPLQLMTYIAGHTRRINFGTSIVVLPWHHPLRVAEEISLLNNLAPDRRMLLGVGRGVAPFEYAALEVPYDDRRERMDESVEILRLALSQESFRYDGTIFRIPQVTLRPRPASPDLFDSLLVAATSDETLVEGGRRGLGIIYSGQKSTGLTRADVALLNRERVAAGYAPSQPVLLPWLFCAKSEQQARERLLEATPHLLMDLTNNYDQGSWDRSDRTPGYEAFFKEMTSDPAALDRFASMQIYGTPEQCLEQVRAMQAETGARNISFQVQWGNIDHAEALASITLFATEALEKLHSIPAGMPDWLVEDAHAAPAAAAV